MMLVGTIFAALSILGVLPVIMGEPPSTTDFFPNIKDNLTKVTWAHAVNNAQYLEEVLQGEIMMIEADIVLGTLIDDPSGTLQPIMGHPPADTSDLSLEQFLQRIQLSNTNKSRSAKGVKIDFKSIQVFEMSTKIIDVLYAKVHYPVWINADIVLGPVRNTGNPVDPTRFLQGLKSYPAAMLSPGWTTSYGGAITNGSYSDKHIADMLEALSTNSINHTITFPVRAGIAADSLEQMQRLLDKTENFTLTIWSGESDPVDVEKLRTLIFTCGLNRIYIDVPKSLMDQLNLDKI